MRLSGVHSLRSRASISISLSASLAALFFSVCATAAYSQSSAGLDPSPPQPGRNGRHMIQGMIRCSDGRPLDKRISLKLSSAASGDQFATTDEAGAFVFRGLRGGTYHISADAGQKYEAVSERVDIIEQPGQPVVTLQISLRPKERMPEAVGTIDASHAAVPESALKHYRKALEAGQAGKREKAVEELRKALSLCPDFMLALNELGVQYLRLRQTDKAIDALRSALKIAPDAFAPRLNYGLALLQMKDYAAASAELQQACEKEGHSASAHLHLGRALIGLARYEAAEKALKQAITIGGGEATEAHRFLAAVYIEKRENARAADELDRYLLLAPGVKDADQIRRIIDGLRKEAPPEQR